MDGHERPDVKYRLAMFFQSFEEIRSFLVTWSEEGHIITLQAPPPPRDQKPLVPATRVSVLVMGNDDSGWSMANSHCSQRPGERSGGVWLSDTGEGWPYLIQYPMQN